MLVLCERCCGEIFPRDPFIRLGHIVSVRPDGEPVFRFAYLHAYDEETGGCAGMETSVDAA